LSSEEYFGPERRTPLQNPPFRWNPEISAGTLISAAVMVVAIVGSALSLLRAVDDAKSGVGRVELRIEKMEPKIDEQGKELTRLATQITEINEIRDRIRDLEKRQ
jgi:cell division protein FtsL